SLLDRAASAIEARSAGSRSRHNRQYGRRRNPSAILLAPQSPSLFVDSSVMRPADQAKIFQLRRPAIRPVNEVMPITPGRRPIAPGEDTVPIPRRERPTRGGRNAPAGVGYFVLELAKSG